MRKVRRAWWLVAVLVLAGIVFAYWRYEYSLHSSPLRALALTHRTQTAAPLHSMRFGSGVVIFGVSGTNSYAAWYATRSLWGWRLQESYERPRKPAIYRRLWNHLCQPQDTRVGRFQSPRENGALPPWQHGLQKPCAGPAMVHGFAFSGAPAAVRRLEHCAARRHKNSFPLNLAITSTRRPTS